MSQNQEIIEAKLCAFIDGDLDAEGRVEIEKHLEANPQHRRLLESLKATRDLIKWLPREAAPAEVAETLNGQLERSVLLDDDSDFLRPNIWPRVMAAAAIVLLTAGLGLAVYFTLPKSQKNATPYALRPGDSAQGPEAPTNEVDKAEESSARRESQPKVMSKGGTSGAEVMTKSDLMSKAKDANDEAGELARWAKRVDENRDAIAAVATGRRTRFKPISRKPLRRWRPTPSSCSSAPAPRRIRAARSPPSSTLKKFSGRKPPLPARPNTPSRPVA